MRTLARKALIALVILVLIGGSAAWYARRDGPQGPLLRTVPVKRGDLVATISATGTVEPEEVVDVGAQVAGQILTFGSDSNGRQIDYGSAVEEGTVLARIDDSLYAADVAQSKAAVELARAGVQRAEADLEQMKAKFHQAERDWNRAQKLGPSDALAQSQYDAYQSAYETAKANVAVGEAAIVQARSTVAQAQANLARAQRNLGYCTITSPVKGVIIDRRVNIGQTVVSSLNAPSLFLIAKDLTRVQVWVAVNEADIGSIHPGQTATFTVDAFPGRVFHGTVNKVRLNAVRAGFWTQPAGSCKPTVHLHRALGGLRLAAGPVASVTPGGIILVTGGLRQLGLAQRVKGDRTKAICPLPTPCTRGGSACGTPLSATIPPEAPPFPATPCPPSAMLCGMPWRIAGMA